MRLRSSGLKLSACIAALALGACASTSSTRAGAPAAQWAANGWLTPGGDSEPEIIGLFDDQGACEDAVDDWLSRQVVGNPVRGECLPIDHR